MDYLWLKAFHIAAVATWIGGMLAAAVTVSAIGRKAAEKAADRSMILNAMRYWDRRVTTPAMLLVWALGLTLAIQGGWFTAPWLQMKLALVFLLSALHGILSGTLRRLAGANGSSSPTILRYGPVVIVIALLAIVVLVVIKPF
ncbi:CopD family protein [Rhizobium sp. 16-449-1b]|uniref:CopD family protein n=1 Tax=Rhizobium sp. 16-449-1b TaxID=2819989 RepID=UPI001ADC412F|nr:CopD family protein [Rhizobium sp. 16-449-1b]MBO9195925.1 CopD family protein [Rhizobium sp. 16-449-1b]